MSLKKKRLGEMLLDLNYISQEQLQQALEKQGESSKRLGEIMIGLEFITQAEIADVLAQQIGITRFRLDEERIEKEALHLLDKRFMQKNMAVPIRKEEDYLIVALQDPLNIILIDEIKKRTGFKVLERIATKKEVEYLISNYYKKKNQIEQFMAKMNLDERIEEDIVSRAEESAPIVNLVNEIISLGVNLNASDIHIEPFAEITRVRYRVDGILYKEMELTKKIHRAVVSRIKIMSELDISEKYVPQDGKINMKIVADEIDLRISTLPATEGEKVVIRILDKSNIELAFEKLGFLDKDLKLIKDLFQRPYGILLLTGPTGSGKTTTLYTILKELNKVDKNIVTIEDPVEYKLHGITQVQTNKNLDFASGLRSILRQDPDIIMVGEIRDQQTAEIAINAALTGHLVLSTLHTNTSAGALTRLINIGIEPFLVASAVIGVISQRLVRTICEECKYEIDKDSNLYKLYLKKIRKYVKEQELELYSSNGCKTCNDFGYDGRTAIYEILNVSETIKELIIERSSATKIQKVASQAGMKLLEENGLKKVKEAKTTFEEVSRLTKL